MLGLTSFGYSVSFEFFVGQVQRNWVQVKNELVRGSASQRIPCHIFNATFHVRWLFAAKHILVFWRWWGRTTSFLWANLGEFLRPKNQDGSDVLQGASLNSFGEFLVWQIVWWWKFVCIQSVYILHSVYDNTLLAWVFWKSFAKFVVLDMAKSADKGCGISGKLPSNFVETFMSIRPWRKTALNAGTSRRDADVGLLFWGSTASGVLCLYCCKCVLWLMTTFGGTDFFSMVSNSGTFSPRIFWIGATWKAKRNSVEICVKKFLLGQARGVGTLRKVKIHTLWYGAWAGSM